MSKNKVNNGPKHGSGRAFDGLVHLSMDKDLFERAVASAKDHLGATYYIPPQCLDGTAGDLSITEYTQYICKQIPKVKVPHVPEKKDIQIPFETEREAIAMEEQAGEEEDEDTADTLRIQAEQLREMARDDIYDALVQERERAEDANELVTESRKEAAKKQAINLRAAKHFLVTKWPQDAGIALQLTQQTGFKPVREGDSASSIRDIFQFARKMVFGAEVKLDKELIIEDLKEKLKAKKQLQPYGYYSYLQSFTEGLAAVEEHAGKGAISQVVLIKWFYEGLHDKVFEDQKKDCSDPVKKQLYSKDLPGFITEMTARYVVWFKDHPKGEDSKDNSMVLKIEEKKSKKSGNSKPSSSPPTVPGSATAGSASASKSSTSTGSSEGRKEWTTCPMCEKKHPPGCANKNAIKSYFDKQRSKAAEEEKKLIEEAEKKSAELSASVIARRILPTKCST